MYTITVSFAMFIRSNFSLSGYSADVFSQLACISTFNIKWKNEKKKKKCKSNKTKKKGVSLIYTCNSSIGFGFLVFYSVIRDSQVLMFIDLF